MSNTTPQELFEAFDDATNGGSRTLAGRTDAIVHVGKLFYGEWSPEYVADIQAELADPQVPDYDAQYHYGYLTAWNALVGLTKGESLKMIAKNNG